VFRATPATSPATTTTAYKDDIALMKALGSRRTVQRFMPRVLPEGTGHVNQRGLDSIVGWSTSC